MKTIINEEFMLHNEPAKRLYHEHAERLPIIDYHCHISPEMIASNHRFRDLTELMLGGDHYKWRIMRASGVDERLITGDADPFETFQAYAKSLESAIGNPLYHWTHLELYRYFGIDEALTEESARRIYDRANEMLADPSFFARGLIERSNVETICTTDDPADTLAYHRAIRSSDFGVKVYPAFRPDKALNIGADTFLPYMEKLSADSFDGLLNRLSERIRFFRENGCRVSDHALESVPFAEGDPDEIFRKRLTGGAVTKHETDVFQTAVLRHLAREYKNADFVMQLHIGALRNNHSRMFSLLGPDTGFDAIADHGIAEPLSKLLDSFEQSGALPKTILYSLNQKDNLTLAALAGCFQETGISGKIQLGSAWWYNDQRDGMEAQLKTLANVGVLGTFIGMLTDSRSFISYPRHEYFRRILSNLIGTWIESGEYPASGDAAGRIVEAISYRNAKTYFGFE